MEYYGYAGKILHVDLTSGKIRKEPLDIKTARDFIGAFGINQKLAYDLIKPGIDPLSPENVIIVGAGPLTGTLTPISGKVSATTKSPMLASQKEEKYNIITSIGGSRRFGVMLKSAGYDHLVITGKAPKPSYLKIINDDIEICDAGSLWSKDLYDSADELMNRHKGATGKCGIWNIGRAGENRVVWAQANVDKLATLGRCGAGAVLGAKNLKAVVTLGSKGIKAADNKKVMALFNEVYQDLAKYPEVQAVPTPYCTTGSGAISEEYPLEIYPKTKGVSLGCLACPLACRDSLTIRDGRFAGLYSPRLQMQMVRDFGRRLKIKDYRDMIWLLDHITRLGMDMLTALKMIFYIARLAERQVISAQDMGGLVLQRGDLDAYVKLLEKIVNREDLGEVIANGWYRLAERVGEDAGKDFKDGCSIAKGWDTVTDARFEGVTPRLFTMTVRPSAGKEGIGDTYLHRGPDLSKDTYFPNEYKASMADLRRGAERMAMTKEEIDRIFVSPPGFLTTRLSKHAEEGAAVYDSMGLGGQLYHHGFPMRNFQRIADFYTAVTGFPVTPRELKKNAERALNMEKLLQIREGFNREDDAVPALWAQHSEEPIKLRTGDSYLTDWFGNRLSKADLSQFLDDYYDERGWDIKSGIPTKAKLAELGLEQFAKDL